MEQKHNVLSFHKMPTTVNRRAFFGFTVFDAFHLICATILMILSYLESPIDALSAAECGAEIVFSFLLVAFIASLAEHNEHSRSFRPLYGFAWLTAVASLFVPLTFSIPEIVIHDYSELWMENAAIMLTVFAMIFYFAAFVLLFIASFFGRRSQFWSLMIYIAMILVLTGTTLKFASNFFFPESVAKLIVEAIKDLAPITPAVLGFTLWGDRGFNEFGLTQEKK